MENVDKQRHPSVFVKGHKNEQTIKTILKNKKMIFRLLCTVNSGNFEYIQNRKHKLETKL